MTTATSLYGQSLYDLAAEEGLSEEILKEMGAVDSIFRENPDYITLLLEPSIPRRERLGLLEEAFKDQLHPYLMNFLMILLENNLDFFREDIHPRKNNQVLNSSGYVDITIFVYISEITGREPSFAYGE